MKLTTSYLFNDDSSLAYKSFNVKKRANLFTKCEIVLRRFIAFSVLNKFVFHLIKKGCECLFKKRNHTLTTVDNDDDSKISNVSLSLMKTHRYLYV